MINPRKQALEIGPTWLPCCRYADGPKYYSDPRLLSFELQPYTAPKGFNPAVASQETMLQLHLQALTFQLSQLYAAAALATLLDRTLVLPPLECYCWSAAGSTAGVEGPGLPVDCRARGDSSSSADTGPFNCTLEQVRDVAGGREGYQIVFIWGLA